MLIACIAKVSAQNSNSQVTGGNTTDDISLRVGPQYMPTDIASVKAPFDVRGIKRPVFANRTTTVKMKRNGKDFLRIQDAYGFVVKNASIKTSSAPSAILDGCQGVMLLDMDFSGKQLKVSKKNARAHVTYK